MVPELMRAMRLHQLGPMPSSPDPLVLDSIPVPRPKAGQVLIRVIACGVCHTELDEIEGRLAPRRLPMTPGHQVCGEVVLLGSDCDPRMLGKRVGVAWIYSACGNCSYCQNSRENLCGQFQATGKDQDGGYAEYMLAPADFVIPLPEGMNPVQAAPLLCAGAVGSRALSMTGIKDGQSLGLTGFGASGHLVLQMARARFPGSRFAVFARSSQDRAFALELGADWAGNTEDAAPFGLDAIIDTTPAWLPVSAALTQLKPGGKLIVNAIRKEEQDKNVLQDLDYAGQLWMEKSLQSVANVTREDVVQCLHLAADSEIESQVTTYELAQANQALHAIRGGTAKGALVLLVSSA